MRENSYTKELIKAAKVIKAGGIVLFPTETVYGIGANGLNDDAVNKIFIVKSRAQDNPLILHISDMDMLSEVAVNISELEYKLMDAFWPGPFTIILNKKKGIAKVASCGGDTIGVRMPSNKIAHDLIKMAGVPIAAPSANISGKPSGTNLPDIIYELKDKVDYIIDGGQTDIGLESTVVRVIDGKVKILRPGKVTKEDIEKVIKSVEVDKRIMQVAKDNEQVLSPGMKYRHYAPKTHCKLVYSKDPYKMKEEILRIASGFEKAEVLVLSYTEDLEAYKEYQCIDIGSRNNLNEVSHNIFSALRKIDKMGVDLAVIEGVSTKRFRTCYYE